MCHKCEENKAAPVKPISVPGALYDIESRVDACITIVGCILELIPATNQGIDLTSRVIDVSNLAAALDDILGLCREDVKRTFEELGQRGNHGC